MVTIDVNETSIKQFQRGERKAEKAEIGQDRPCSVTYHNGQETTPRDSLQRLQTLTC